MTLLYPDQPLSDPELQAAALEGSVIPTGYAYRLYGVPETPEIRGASLIYVADKRFVVEGFTAAWIHGALERCPRRIHVKRASIKRLAHVHDPRLIFRDLAVRAEWQEQIGGINVTSPGLTFADVLRIDGNEAHIAASRLARLHPGVIDEVEEYLPKTKRAEGLTRARNRLGLIARQHEREQNAAKTK